MKQICAHVDTMGEAVTALESDENGDFFRDVVSERTREHEKREANRCRLEPGDVACWIENAIVEAAQMATEDRGPRYRAPIIVLNLTLLPPAHGPEKSA
jgi:hypothetical protein